MLCGCCLGVLLFSTCMLQGIGEYLFSVRHFSFYLSLAFLWGLLDVIDSIFFSEENVSFWSWRQSGHSSMSIIVLSWKGEFPFIWPSLVSCAFLFTHLLLFQQGVQPSSCISVIVDVVKWHILPIYRVTVPKSLPLAASVSWFRAVN